MKKIISLSIILIICVSIGFSVSISAEENKIPQWIKSNAEFWINGQISDTEFLKSIEFLVENQIINIPKIAQLEQENKVARQVIIDLENDYHAQYDKRESLEKENRELEEMNNELVTTLEEVEKYLKNEINSQTAPKSEQTTHSQNEQIPTPPKYTEEFLDSSWNGQVTKYLPNQNDLDSIWTMGQGFYMYDKPPLERTDGSTRYYYEHENYGTFIVKISKNQDNFGYEVSSVGNVVEHESIPSYCILSWAYHQGYDGYGTYYVCVKGDIFVDVHKKNLWSGAESLEKGIGGTSTLANIILDKLN